MSLLRGHRERSRQAHLQRAMQRTAGPSGAEPSGDGRGVHRIFARGYVAGSIGFATAFREILLGLERAGFSIFVGEKPRGLTTTSSTGTEADALQRWRRNTGAWDAELTFLPLHRLPASRSSCRRRIAIAEFEALDVPPRYAPVLNTYYEIWCPSEHGVEAFRAAGVTVPVLWMPHGVDTDVFLPDAVPRPREREEPGLRLLTVALFEPRKGYDVLFAAAARALGPGDEIIIAGHRASRDAILGLARTYSSPGGFSDACVRVANTDLSREELVGLYRSADAFVLPTRGEGDCLPLREALAVGLPVVTTAAPPMSESVCDDTGFLIRATPRIGLPRAYGTSRRYYAERLFSEPDVDHLASILGSLRGLAGRLPEMGAVGRSRVTTSRTWDHVVARMASRLRG